MRHCFIFETEVIQTFELLQRSVLRNLFNKMQNPNYTLFVHCINGQISFNCLNDKSGCWGCSPHPKHLHPTPPPHQSSWVSSTHPPSRVSGRLQGRLPSLPRQQGPSLLLHLLPAQHPAPAFMIITVFLWEQSMWTREGHQPWFAPCEGDTAEIPIPGILGPVLNHRARPSQDTNFTYFCISGLSEKANMLEELNEGMNKYLEFKGGLS